MSLLKFLFLLLVTSITAQNYNYGLDTKKVTTQNAVEKSLVQVIPQNFDWQNIPMDYSDSVWEIRYDFDLAGQTIILPENVIIRFNGGILSNGTVRGDESNIESNTESQIFDALTLAGTFKNEYLKPQWFGAVMDGTADDRGDFVETLAQAENIRAKVLVDRNMFLDVEETGEKSIFLEDNTWIEGANNANIIINNLLSPAFYMALTKNIVIKNITFLYDNTYDASYGEGSSGFSNNFTLNLRQLRDYFRDTKGIKFNGLFPKDRGFICFYSIFLLEAAENITFEKVTFKAKGATADKFILMAIKMKEQYSKNQSINSKASPTVISKNIKLKNVTMDGTIMGIQGLVDGFHSEGLKSYRYSDMQDAKGGFLGGFDGRNYDFPPPHLIYLNNDLSTNFQIKNVTIKDTYDYGEYVGTVKVRGRSGINIGYCNSLKLVDNIENVVVDDYKSFRRDGFADIGDLRNGSFRNIYAEYNSSIFDPKMRFVSMRFIGKLYKVSFENITLKDRAEVSTIYPINFPEGDHVEMNNVSIDIDELNTVESGPFAIFGSNNKVVNSKLSIQKFSATKENLGVINLDQATRNNGINNHYEVEVEGWRDISTRTTQKSIQLIFQNPTNPNPNYAKVTDVNNNFISEIVNGVKKDVWKRTEEVNLGQGKTYKLAMDIPYNFTVSKISAATMEPMSSNISASVGTSVSKKSNVITALSNSLGEVSKKLDLDASEFNHFIYIYSSGDFNNQGKLRFTVELTRLSEP